MTKIQFFLSLLIILNISGYTDICGQEDKQSFIGNNMIYNVSGKPQIIPGNILQLYDYKFNFSPWDEELPIETENFHPDSTKAWAFITPEDSVLINRKSLVYNHSGYIEEFNQDTLMGFIFSPFGMRTYSNRTANYYYNASGDIISLKLKSANGEFLGEKTWEYNDNGLIKDFIYNEGMVYKKISKTYYSNGSPKKQERTIKTCQHYGNMSGCLSWREPEKQIIYFNHEGIPDSGLIINKDSVPVVYDYEHDENKHIELIKEIREYGNDSTVLTIKIQDTEDNRRIFEYTHESYTYSSRRYYFTERSIANLNEDGKRVSGEYYRWDYDKKTTDLQTTDTLMYDSSGRLRYIHSMSWDDEFKGSDHLREFQYDSKGNLTSYSIYNRGFLNEWSLYEKRYYYHPIAVRSTNIVKDIDDKIIIYPNPASDCIFYDMVNSGYELSHYEIHDLRGLKLFSGSLKGNSDNSIDISGLKQGIYLIYFYEEGNREVIFFSKIIKH